MEYRSAPPGTAAGGHGGYDPARFKLRTQKNDEQVVKFIISMVVLAAVFILVPFARRLGASRSPTSRFSRILRRYLLRPMLILPSIGHGTLAGIYLIINACLAFTNTDPALTPISNFGSRMAWMAIANMMVVVILALKNTPLALISPWSYERLNILHQVAGCTTVIFVILHACLYTVNFTSQGRPERLLERDEIFGMVAGLSFVVLGFAGMVIRRWWYELFYYVHITFWMLGLVMTGLHQPEVAKKVVYVVPVAGGIWVLDRIIRFTRLAFYSNGNYVTVTPLSNGATRVTLEKAPIGARPGKHCYLWIPRIRPTEAHPFTIVSMEPVEFVIMSYDGFTSALHSFAKSKPGGKLRASIDGPYGSNPDPMKYDKTILVAGGSGVTFTLSIALDMVRKMSQTDNKEVVFIWIVKQKAYLSWFAEQLNELQHDARFKVKLYVTRETIEEATNPLSRTSSPDMEKSISATGDPEKDAIGSPYRPSTWRSRTMSSGKESNSDYDLASPIEGVESDVHNVPVNYERPKVAELVDAAIADVAGDQRVLVMACGPQRLSEQVRETAARRISPGGPSIELHCEQFGW